MALNVISNFAANVAHRNLVQSDKALTDSLAKLSSGTRVVSAKDDAASMAIGSRLRAEIAALRQAAVNSSQGVSMLQVADGAMGRSHEILLRMKTLSVQAGSGQLSATERSMLDTEYQALLSEVDRIALDTEFNGNQLVNGGIVFTTGGDDFKVTAGVQSIVFRGDFTDDKVTIKYDTGQKFTVVQGSNNFTGSIDSGVNDGSTMSTGTVVQLTLSGNNNKIDIVLNTAFDVDKTRGDGTLDLSGSNTSSFTFKVGTGISPTADEITVKITAVSKAALGLGSTNVKDKTQADAASAAITGAVDAINTARADVGAAQNRLDFAAVNIATTLENMEAARSNILDLDIASEMSRFTSKQILVQAGVAMLAQANQGPQALLRLFQ